MRFVFSSTIAKSFLSLNAGNYADYEVPTSFLSVSASGQTVCTWRTGRKQPRTLAGGLSTEWKLKKNGSTPGVKKTCQRVTMKEKIRLSVFVSV